MFTRSGTLRPYVTTGLPLSRIFTTLVCHILKIELSQEGKLIVEKVYQ